MAATDSLWVLDTSVAAAWFFEDDPSREHALAVRASLKDDPASFVVPHLFYSELVHVLARKSGRREPFVRAAMQIVVRLGLRTLALSEPALVSASAWACKSLGGYDATFVTLAEELGGRWLTADERGARKAGTSRAISLSAWARKNRPRS